MSNANFLHAQYPVISQEKCNIFAQRKLCLHHCSFYANVVHDAVNNFHFEFNFATVCIKWKIYAQLHDKQTKYWKWTIHSHKGFCRTGPATPGLLNIIVFLINYFKNIYLSILLYGQVFASLSEHLHYKILSNKEVWKKWSLQIAV